MPRKINYPGYQTGGYNLPKPKLRRFLADRDVSPIRGDYWQEGPNTRLRRRSLDDLTRDIENLKRGDVPSEPWRVRDVSPMERLRASFGLGPVRDIKNLEGWRPGIDPLEPWPGYTQKYRGGVDPEELIESGDPLSPWWTGDERYKEAGRAVQDWTREQFEGRYGVDPTGPISDVVPEIEEAQKLWRAHNLSPVAPMGRVSGGIIGLQTGGSTGGGDPLGGGFPFGQHADRVAGFADDFRRLGIDPADVPEDLWEEIVQMRMPGPDELASRYDYAALRNIYTDPQAMSSPAITDPARLLTEGTDLIGPEGPESAAWDDPSSGRPSKRFLELEDLDRLINDKKQELFELEMHMEYDPSGGARDMHPEEATELYKVESKLDKELDDLYRRKWESRGYLGDQRERLAQVREGLEYQPHPPATARSSFAPMPEIQEYLDFRNDVPRRGRIKDAFQRMGRNFITRGRGIRSLALPAAGALAASTPVGLAADVLGFPERLGSGDLPYPLEDDPSHPRRDEDRIKYYSEIMKQLEDSPIGLPSSRFSRRPSGDSMTRNWARRRFGRASGGIIGLQTGGAAPAVSQVTSYGVPQQTEQQWANLTDRIVTEGQRPYQQYGGQRIAGFTQPEAAAMAGRVAYGQGVGPMGTRQAAQTLGQAGQMVGGAQQGLMGLQPQYAQLATQFGAAAPLAQQQAQQAATGIGQLGARAELQGQLAGAGMRQTGAAGQLQQEALGAGEAAAGQAAQAQMTGLGGGMAGAGQAALAAQQGFGTGMVGMGTQAQQLGQQAMGQVGAMGTGAQQLGRQALTGITGAGTAAQQAGAQAAQTMRGVGARAGAPEMLRGANLQDYMSQYTGAVTDPQLRQLQEFQKQQAQELGSQAAGAGAFGGYRQAVQQGQQQQAAAQQAADIIGKGQKESFESAQQAFERDRAARAAGLGQQLSAEQQAAAAQQAGLGAAQAAQQAGFGAAQAGTAQQLQAAEQATAAGQQGLQAQMAAQQQAAQMGDVGAARQLQGLQAQIGAAGQGAQFGQQGLAAQRAAAQAGVGMSQAGQQQGLQAAQAGTQLGLGALQAAQGVRQQGFDMYGNLLGQQQGAIGAQGQALGQMGQMGAQLAGVGGRQMQLGGLEQQQQLERLRGMEAAGEKQRQMQQQSLGMGYQDWQNQLNQERANIGWQQSAMGGLPYQGTTTQSRYEAPGGGGGGSWMGTGIAAMGLYDKYRRNQQGAMPQSSGQFGGTPAATSTAPVPAPYPKPSMPNIPFTPSGFIPPP